ncbi:hypothetical protein CYMTET_43765 [Cymbomonas tetramitiformis]|uniref:Uncharacterized protein n=1 Tax=Cymbomonas tetramitiformis TaxID=36881 RepID=A0AAE0C2T1_9CHLO|nr:hypothetical protein CYMTET_43765 [Cymbomonas tetramitiformis]
MAAIQASSLRLNAPVVSARKSLAQRVPVKSAPTQKRIACVTRAEKPQRTGFVQEDNSGKANIFAVEPKQLWISSPGRDAAASEGLGGIGGNLGVFAAVVGIGAATFIVGNTVFDAPVSLEAFELEDLKSLSYYLENL